MTPSPNGRPPLTERQAELLLFVRAYRASHGKPPSVTQIARALKSGRGIATSTVSLHLLRIRAKGYEVPLANNNGVHPAGICSACPARVDVLRRALAFMSGLTLSAEKGLMRDQLVDAIAGVVGEV
jgi:hypothetical protein